MKTEHVVVLTSRRSDKEKIFDRVKYPIRQLHGDRVVISIHRDALDPDGFDVLDYLNSLRDYFVYFDTTIPTPIVMKAAESVQPFGIIYQEGDFDRLYHYARREGQTLFILALLSGVPDSKDDRILRTLSA